MTTTTACRSPVGPPVGAPAADAWDWLRYVVLYVALALLAPLLVKLAVWLARAVADSAKLSRKPVDLFARHLESIVTLVIVELMIWFAVSALPWPPCDQGAYQALQTLTTFVFTAVVCATGVVGVSRAFDFVAALVDSSSRMAGLTPQAIAARTALSQLVRFARYVIVFVVAIALTALTLSVVDTSLGWISQIPFQANVVSILLCYMYLVPALHRLVGGVDLLAVPPFALGDVVEINGIVGVVSHMGLFSFSLRDAGGRAHYVAASRVVTDAIVNHSRRAFRLVDFAVAVPASAAQSDAGRRLFAREVERDIRDYLGSLVTGDSLPGGAVLVTHVPAGMVIRCAETNARHVVQRSAVRVRFRTRAVDPTAHARVKSGAVLRVRALSDSYSSVPAGSGGASEGPPPPSTLAAAASGSTATRRRVASLSS